MKPALTSLPVSSVEVVAIVLIDGGISGKKWKAGVNNVLGMSRSYKTVVLYIKEPDYFKAALQTGLAYQGVPLSLFPKTPKYRALAMT